MELASVERIYMTNSPFDTVERSVWEKGFDRDERFLAALRIDPLLLSWPETSRQLARRGYKTTGRLTQKTASQARRFLADWTQRMDARYLMVSLPPDFRYPAKDDCTAVGTSVTLQHSDARVFDQIIYKWRHSKEVIARVLAAKYADPARTGWQPTRREVERDLRALFGGAFEKFCRGGRMET